MNANERKDLAAERQFGPEEVLRAKSVCKRPVQQEMFRRPQRVVSERELAITSAMAKIQMAVRQLLAEVSERESA